ncbi:MAG: DEAD/DEAH box helicase [Cellvibrio sp.]|nr:DEAD/DEAH box helicase [Cellvibrio sp.]
MLNQLPIFFLKDQFSDLFDREKTFLIEAEPGAGKSTLVPLWVLEKLPKDKQVWLIQPRVLATLALAKRLTELANHYFQSQYKLGERVGYQVPFDNRQSTSTQLLLMTPGILLQHLLHNPTLDNVACVILDEVHERSVNQDLAFVFLQEASILRDDLQLILMSATPDPSLQKLIQRRLFTPGRQFPVETRFLPKRKNPQQQKYNDETLPQQVLRAFNEVADWQEHCCLVFLPGWKEIENCRTELSHRFPQHKILCLHSRVSSQEQMKALDESEGPRIILSTNIAETSLTIPDVTLVIDSGLMRRVDYEQRTGISNLRTSMISQSSADQRRGRAGRVQAGICIRLWSQDTVLAAADLPELRSTDYLPLALRLAHWASPVEDLQWIEKPNPLALDYARQELRKMDFLDQNHAITESGKMVSQLGTSPRVAALLISQKLTISDELLLLALVIHFDFSSEIFTQDWHSIASKERAKNSHWQLQQRRWLGYLKLTISQQPINSLDLAKAFSDRIGFLLSSGKYRLNSGMSVGPINKIDSFWGAFPVIDAAGKESFALGFPLQLTSTQQKELSQLKTELVFKQVWSEYLSWWMGGVVIEESYSQVTAADIGDKLGHYLQNLANDKSITQLGWCEQSLGLLARARILQNQVLVELPEISDQALTEKIPQWLSPFLTCDSKLDQLPWLQALNFYFGSDKISIIQKMIPEKIILPSGRSVNIEINHHNQLMVSAKLQEFFGCEELMMGDGKLPLQIHLLSPNGSPLAITSDLRSFWKQSYPEVCKEMRGRYPRHPWPDDPMSHQATALTKRKLSLNQN